MSRDYDGCEADVEAEVDALLAEAADDALASWRADKEAAGHSAEPRNALDVRSTCLHCRNPVHWSDYHNDWVHT